MGKKSRKKMERKKDFQKVKLKVGKKKPMPDNFTKTAFKSQGILLREQFKAGSANQTTNESLHGCLCSVNHYNAKVRTTTLIKLKELLASNRTLVQDNLAALVQNITHTFTDRDEKARQAGLAVMKQIMINAESERMVPFFPTLCAHLSCAMTHIQEDIRLDALKILDLLLVHYPSLVIGRSQDLLMNFVHQISQHGTRNSQGGGIQLSITPGSRFSGQKWRIQVLHRLKSFLSAIVDSKQEQSTKHRRQTQTSEREVVVLPTRDVYVGIYRTINITQNVESQGNILRSFSLQDDSATQDFTSSLKEVAGFAEKVIPLLIQTWMEARPHHHGNQSGGDVTLTPVTMEMLHSVLSVLQLLWRWLDVLCQETGQFDAFLSIQKKFEKHLIESFQHDFPYAVHERKTQQHSQRKPTASSSDPMEASEKVNLLACDVMSYLIRGDGKQRWRSRLLQYVVSALERRKQVSTEHAQMLLGVVMRVMGYLMREDSKLKLLEALFKFYKNSHLLSQNKRLAMTCIADITVLHKKMEFRDADVTAYFIETIPQLVIQLGTGGVDSSHHALQILHHSAAVGHPSAVACIQRNFETLLNPKTALIQTYPERLQRQLIELLHWVTVFRLESFRTMCSSFLLPEVPATTVCYAVQILACKLLRRNEQLPYQLSDFISFLITLALGCQMKDLQKCQVTHLTNQRHLPEQASHLKIVESSDELLIKSQKICSVVCQSLRLLSEEEDTWRIYQSVASKLLGSIENVPYIAAYGLLYIVKERDSHLEVADQLSSQLVALLASVLYASLHDYSSDCTEGPWHGVLWQLSIDILTNRRDLFGDMLGILKTAVTCHRDTDQLRLISSAVTRLLQTEDLKQVWGQNRSQLENFLTSLELHEDLTKIYLQQLAQMLSHMLSRIAGVCEWFAVSRVTTENMSESRWLAELKYESSLYLGKG